jgi:hypothetical protein
MTRTNNGSMTQPKKTGALRFLDSALNYRGLRRIGQAESQAPQQYTTNLRTYYSPAGLDSLGGAAEIGRP